MATNLDPRWTVAGAFAIGVATLASAAAMGVAAARFIYDMLTSKEME